MKYLNKEIEINDLKLSNRLAMPPMASGKPSEDGTVCDKLCDYYHERAIGGYIGLIITEHCYISMEGKAHAGQMSIANDSDIDGLKKLTSAIKIDGTKAFAQISHAGSAAEEKVTGFKPVGASSVYRPGKNAENSVLPEELSHEHIAKICEEFAKAALRAKKAGYDGVEIHSAHGYLLNQFYSPITNKRTDEYGGSLENRIRFHLEIIDAVRKAVGNDYPVAIRLGGCDYMEGGSSIEDSVKASILFEKAGIDMLDISGGMNGYMVKGRKEAGYFSDMTKAIKAAVSVPVLLTGGVTKPEEAEELLKDGAADIIAVGRAMLKDARWAEKAFTK